ncbi:unnamed protein product, partial [Scytosiphon promiscuus]
VNTRLCIHDSCNRTPRFNARGRKRAAYCKIHAADGMLDIRNRHCSHDTCTRVPTWGVPTDGVATACASHKSDILGYNVVNFKARCQVGGCVKLARWGLDGK